MQAARSRSHTRRGRRTGPDPAGPAGGAPAVPRVGPGRTVRRGGASGRRLQHWLRTGRSVGSRPVAPWAHRAAGLAAGGAPVRRRAQNADLQPSSLAMAAGGARRACPLSTAHTFPQRAQGGSARCGPRAAGTAGTIADSQVSLPGPAAAPIRLPGSALTLHRAADIPPAALTGRRRAPSIAAGCERAAAGAPLRAAGGRGWGGGRRPRLQGTTPQTRARFRPARPAARTQREKGEGGRDVGRGWWEQGLTSSAGSWWR